MKISGKKEITLDQSKSLENVKVRKIRVARNNKKSNPEEHINKNECQFCLVKDFATEDQNTEHHVSNAQRRLQMARGLLHPRHQMRLAQLLSQALSKEGEFWREKVLAPSICSNIKPRTENNNNTCVVPVLGF